MNPKWFLFLASINLMVTIICRIFGLPDNKTVEWHLQTIIFIMLAFAFTYL